MNDNEQRRHGLTAGIRSLWINWAFSLGAVVLCLFAPLFLSKVMLPFFMLGITLLIFTLVRNNRSRTAPYCFKIPYIIALVLLWSGVIIAAVLAIIDHDISVDLNGQPYNNDMPYFTIMVIAPVGTLICFRFLKRKNKCAFCSDCEARLGDTVERGFLGRIFTQEANYQTKVLVYAFLALTVIEWIFYFTGYINTNISRRDFIFYIGIPTVTYIVSLIYMFARYYILWAYYCVNDNGEDSHNGFSRIRFLVICDDKIWLNIPDLSALDIHSDNLTIDTPARSEIPFRSKVNTFEAAEYFYRITGLRQARIRELYVSSDSRSASNIFHFAAYINSFDVVNNSSMTGEWFSLADIQRLHTENSLSPLLSAEMYRIHRVVMAWKTYTRDGKRLYAIRHYQPTFRLADMEKWDVDYNDPHWLYVSFNNEDMPFFKLRRLWRKYVTGLGE